MNVKLPFKNMKSPYPDANLRVTRMLRRSVFFERYGKQIYRCEGRYSANISAIGICKDVRTKPINAMTTNIP